MFKRASRLAAIAMTIAAVGCSGSDGAQGPQGAAGATGATGPTGPAGPVTVTNESCMVCHASDRPFTVADAHALPFATGTQKSINVGITNVDVDATSHLVVTFTVGDPTALATLDRTDIQFYVAGYDPTVASTNGDGYFRLYVQERNRTGYPLGTLDPVAAVTGSFTYTTSTALAVPAGTTVQRLFMGVSRAGENAGNAFRDFNFPATLPATAITAVANPRDIVPTATCNKCHVDRIADFGHGGSRNLSEACAVCHSPLHPTYDMSGNKVDYATMVHQIHGRIANPFLLRAGAPILAGNVTYPADIRDCANCHNGAQGTAYRLKPSRQACGSCHTTVNFATGANHPAVPASAAIQIDDTGCATCHNAAAIDSYHRVEKLSTDPGYLTSFAPEFVVSMSITPPASGTFYVAGEAPVVTVQLLKDGVLVPDAFYLGTKDSAAGQQNDRLTNAGLYVYGPRTAPKPVLTTGAAVTPVPKQSQSLLLPSTDPLVITTAGKFAYQLKPIPASMAAGTYMVRFYAQDYGYVNDGNFRVSSNAFTTIQIRTATVQKKIDGDCTRCHGTYNLPPHDARHAVKFNSDECVSCHDLSGNHADPLANRVHAVHSGSATGDLLDANWATTTSFELADGSLVGPLTYPVGARNGGIKNCAVCHSSGNLQYTQNVAEQSCRGCHNDDPAAEAHMLQNGGK